MITLNNHVITTPFKNKTVNVKVNHGFGGSMVHVDDFEVLTVIVGDGHTIPPGSEVYVPAEHCQQPWARKEFNLKGEKVIVVPTSAIIAFERT